MSGPNDGVNIATTHLNKNAPTSANMNVRLVFLPLPDISPVSANAIASAARTINHANAKAIHFMLSGSSESG